MAVPDRPRVVVVSTRLDVGGTERHLARVLPKLRARGIDISLYVLERGGSLEPVLTNGGVAVEGLPPHRSRFLNVLRTGRHLRRHLHERRPEIVHFFLPEPYLVGSLAAWGMETVRIMSRRSLAHYQRHHPALTRLERWLHGRTNALLGNSGAVVAELGGECGDPARVGLIHNGIDLPRPATMQGRLLMRHRVGVPPHAFVLAIVANLIAYKGHEDLFEALCRTKDQLPQPWRLLIIGRDGGIGSRLRQKATELCITDNLMWLDQRDDAEDLFEAADVAVLASHEEGFSNSLVEAMGRGVPVVATAVGGNLDAVIDRQSGLLVPIKAPASLAASIIELAGNPELRARLGENGRQRVETSFSLDACVERYANLYHGMRSGARERVQDIIDPPGYSPELENSQGRRTGA